MLTARFQSTLITAIGCIIGWLYFTSSLGSRQAESVAFQTTENAQPSYHASPSIVTLPASSPSNVDIADPAPNGTPIQETDDGSKHEFPTTNRNVQHYVAAILDPEDTTFERMECPKAPRARYEDLRETSDGKPKYFVALDLYEVEKLLPRLMGSITEVVRYLGPENCAISVIEGRSKDATYAILQALQSELQNMGAKFYLTQNNANPHGEGVDRIDALAELRNLALEPLVKNPTSFSSSAVIAFINDIALCPEDLLELIYQHTYQSAAMTCSMDWIHGGDAFYDVWISRTINSGNIFFNIPEDAAWKYKENLFFDDPPTKQKFKALQPFEVYACWGGMVVLDPTPFISGKVAFRRSDEAECYMGEPTLLAKDLWRLGIGHIATVPTVNVGYTNEDTSKIKNRRGFVSDLVDLSQPPENSQSELIQWSSKPPPMVKCEGVKWNDPSWVAPV